MAGSSESRSAGSARHHKNGDFKPPKSSRGDGFAGRVTKHKGSKQKQKQRQRQRQRAEAANESAGAAAAADGPGVSINALKSHIRSLERRLAHPRLAADVRQDVERQLAQQRRRLIVTSVRRERRSTLAKYHRVRFFERKKAARMVGQARKALAAARAGDDEDDADKLAELQQRLHLAEVDLAYTTHAPLEDVYVSLFPYGYTPDAERELADAQQSKSPLWRLVEQARTDGSIEDVRAGRHPALEALDLGERAALKAAKLDDVQTSPATLQGDVSKGDDEMGGVDDKEDDDADDDDGGFFEPV